jgi:uncharacterized protein (DUF1697 family)
VTPRPGTSVTHVALLRGINVGRAKRVAMAELRLLVEKLGYRDVRTLLNSGNVVFTTPRGVRGDAGKRIEAALLERTGISCRIAVLSAEELGSVIRGNPLVAVADNHSRLLVAVLADEASGTLVRPLLGQDWTPDVLALGRRAAYLWCSSGILASPLAERLAKLLGDHATTRNWATMLKLHALAGGADGSRGPTP